MPNDRQSVDWLKLVWAGFHLNSIHQRNWQVISKESSGWPAVSAVESHSLKNPPKNAVSCGMWTRPLYQRHLSLIATEGKRRLLRDNFHFSTSCHVFELVIARREKNVSGSFRHFVSNFRQAFQQADSLKRMFAPSLACELIDATRICIVIVVNFHAICIKWVTECVYSAALVSACWSPRVHSAQFRGQSLEIRAIVWPPNWPIRESESGEWRVLSSPPL